MAEMKATLFGKFSIQQAGVKIGGLEAHKIQELLAYLLLSRDHPRSRDSLCETLWGNLSTAASRKCLRQTLWRLQSALQVMGNSDRLVLQNDNDWIQIHISGSFWLDIDEFEKIFNSLKGRTTSELSLLDFNSLEYAAGLYKGDLLEGWYADWCIFERERFQIMHLLLLDKLAQFCELHEMYEAGLAYGMDILRHDHSYERAHRQMMRLYFLTGNRTQALHQYRRCEMALREDLGVEPSEATKQLYREICSDKFIRQPGNEERPIIKTKVRTNPVLKEMLERLKEVSEVLHRLEYQIQEEMGTRGDSVPG